MRRFRRIVATAALGVAVSALVAAPAAAENRDWANPDGTRVTGEDPEGWAPGGDPDGTRVTGDSQWWPMH